VRRTGGITVVGLGPGDPRAVPEEAIERMRGADVVLLRTAWHPAVSRLAAEGIVADSFDRLYQQAQTLDEVYREIAGRLLALAADGYRVVYAVPGHPGVAEATVRELAAAQDKVPLEIVGAMSGLDAIFAVVPLDPARGISILDPAGLGRGPLPVDRDLLILQVDERLLAGEVKLKLLAHYPPDHPVVIIRAAGVPGEQEVTRTQLAALDHSPHRYDHLTSILVPALAEGRRAGCRYPLDPLVEVMQRLRSPEGCPWDREQTHQSLKNYVLEEAYELADALEQGDTHKVVDELGDLLLQVVFHGVIAMETGDFDLNQVVQGIVAKLRRRHPHVFGRAKLSSSEEALAQWGHIKAQEVGEEGTGKVLGRVPRGLPALLRATREVHRARAAGCRALGDAVLAAVPLGDAPRARLGRLLLTVVQAAAEEGIDPEAALHEATDRLVAVLEGEASSGGNQLEQGRPGGKGGQPDRHDPQGR